MSRRTAEQRCAEDADAVALVHEDVDWGEQVALDHSHSVLGREFVENLALLHHVKTQDPVRSTNLRACEAALMQALSNVRARGTKPSR